MSKNENKSEIRHRAQCKQIKQNKSEIASVQARSSEFAIRRDAYPTGPAERIRRSMSSPENRT